MNNKVLGCITFAAGALIGSAAAYYIINKQYDKLMEEEIESIKVAFERRYNKLAEEQELKDDLDVEPISSEEQNIVVEEHNTDKGDYEEYIKPYEPTTTKEPYLIAPEELGEYDDYRIVGLTYYADHILTDENDEIIKNVNEIVGKESLKHFGDYEDGAVHVRNEALQTDYEILLDPQTYSEAHLS